MPVSEDRAWAVCFLTIPLRELFDQKDEVFMSVASACIFVQLMKINPYIIY